MKAARTLLLAALAAAASTACGDDVPDHAMMGTLGMGDEGAADGGTTTGPGGGGSEAGATDTGEPPGEVLLDVHLDFEVRLSIDIVITQRDDGEVVVGFTPFRGFGVMEDMTTLSGPGRIDAYPEIGATVYTARIDGPAVSGGPCGNAPVSLALSLHAEEHTDYLAGGITPYCGADTWYGIPVIEPLRIAGLATPRG